jgi:hypothetical protein
MHILNQKKNQTAKKNLKKQAEKEINPEKRTHSKQAIEISIHKKSFKRVPIIF